jgi:hypothetical protein
MCAAASALDAVDRRPVVELPDPPSLHVGTGQASASFAFYCVLLAGLGLGVVGFTSRQNSEHASAEDVSVG